MAIVIRPQGKLDLVGSATLQQKIENVASVTSSSQKVWVIDLEQVTLINHFGLTTLVAARRQAKAKNCRLILRNVKSAVRLMLDIAQLTDGFEIIEAELVSDGDSKPEKTTLNQDNTELTKNNVSIELDDLDLRDGDNLLADAQAKSISNLDRILSDFRSRFYPKHDQ